ncbi:hypothetical protein B7494_g2934 [Chlorociboria aeruginascens]|nr:hypothetical protein B7494_g2934 [Chlorociboria aeruginascens]
MQSFKIFPSLFLLLSSTTFTFASVVWTVNCAPLTIQQTDPILSPGNLSTHVHAVVGGTAFSSLMLGDDAAVDAKATTCDKFIDHSNYWAPQLYQQVGGQFKSVTFTGANMYYKNYTCSYNANASPKGNCVSPRDAQGFPAGLRMIAGNSTRRTLNTTDQWQQAILFENGNYEQYGFATIASQSRVQANVRFPSCWDGVHVDSRDQSHVAYPDPTLGGDTTGGMCPESHPVALISIGAEFGWDITGIWDASTLVFANGDKTGFGFHADFIQGWTNTTALTNSFANCFDSSCPWDSFDAPNGQAPHPAPMVPETAPLAKLNLGLNGLIPQLPGNNPVYAGPMTGIGIGTKSV